MKKINMIVNLLKVSDVLDTITYNSFDDNTYIVSYGDFININDIESATLNYHILSRIRLFKKDSHRKLMYLDEGFEFKGV